MTFIYIVLYGWPIVAGVLFKRYPVPTAIMITLIFGFLFLPSKGGINLPLLPTLNKDSIPAFVALFLVSFVYSSSLTAPGTSSFIPRLLSARLCLFFLLLGAFFTTLTNGDTLFYGPTRFPPMRVYDSFSIILGLLTTMAPFFLAHKFCAHPDAHRSLLKLMVVAALIYSFLALYEVRMSPQLNNQIYGYFPHSFIQHIRGGGYRPLVFLSHGLVLAIFFGMAILAATGLGRTAKEEQRKNFLIIAGWLLLVLILCKSLGALVITLALLPIVFFMKVRGQLLAGMLISILILSYPMLRGAGLVPIDSILSYAEQVNPARADSLSVRLNNEEKLLEKLQQRPIFGWGGYGRSRVVNKLGQDTTIADGTWIILLGIGGWVRYLTQFGLLCLPMIFLFMSRKRLDLGPETSLVALLLSANMIDLIPNSSQTPLTWMFAGALWGRLSLGYVSASDPQAPSPQGKQVIQYARPRPTGIQQPIRTPSTPRLPASNRPQLAQSRNKR